MGQQLEVLASESRSASDGHRGRATSGYLCLSTESSLLHIVSALPLGEQRGLTGLVLGDFVQLMLLALFGRAMRLPRLWHDNLYDTALAHWSGRRNTQESKLGLQFFASGCCRCMRDFSCDAADSASDARGAKRAWHQPI